MFKKILIVICCLFTLLGCSSNKNESKDRLAQIKEKGYIEFVTEPYWAPNEFIDPSLDGDSKYVGTDIELAKYIAEKIGVDLKIVPLDFTAVLTGITEAKYDMAISAIAWSPVRQEAMNLSDGYDFDDTGYGFLIREEDLGKYTCIEDLKDAIVITQSGSVQEAIYNEYCNNAKEFKLVTNMTDAYLAISENKADVCITAIASGQLYAEANGNGLLCPDFKFDVDKKMTSTCVALPLEGTDSLMEIVNECIKELTAADKFNEWTDYYEAYAKSLGIE